MRGRGERVGGFWLKTDKGGNVCERGRGGKIDAKLGLARSGRGAGESNEKPLPHTTQKKYAQKNM